MTKKARSAGVDIAYEIVGEGTPLVLLHLLFDSREFWWRSGYVDSFRSAGRQLVLIDASGHGESSKPHNKEAYSLSRRADEVVTVLDDLKIETTEVLGYSMGGWTALGLVCYHPDRLRAAAIGGTLPYAQDLQPLRDVIAKGPSAWVEFLGSMANELPPDMRQRVQLNNQSALAASVSEDRRDISEQVASSAVPLLFFVGDKDPRRARCMEFAAKTGSRFLTVPGAHHIQTLLERETVVQELLSFFDEHSHR